MGTALLACALVAFAGELKPLDEERGLENRERIALEYARVDAGPAGMVGWQRTTVERAEQDGETRYLVHRIGELADVAEPGITTRESRSIFDGNLELIRSHQRNQLLGEERDALELEWSDAGELRMREGRGKWTPIAGAPRPTPDSDVALFVHGTEIPNPWESRTFDSEQRAVKVSTLEHGPEIEHGDNPARSFDLEGDESMRHVTDVKGIYPKRSLRARP